MILAVSMVFAGGSKETATEQAQAEPPATGSEHIPAGEKPAGKIHLVMWSSFSGDAGKSIENAAASFNASQSDYEVEVISTSSIATKVRASNPSDRPNMFVTSGNDSASFISEAPESRKYVPVQEFVDYDGYDTSKIYPNLKTTYSRNGQWQSFPIASTSVGVYYNVTVLKEHGIDFNELNSLEDIYEAGLKLKAEGIATPIFFNTASVDFLNYFLCAEGLVYWNNDNGRDGIPTASYFGEEGKVHDAVQRHFELLKKMSEAGLLASTELVPADRYGMFAKQDFVISFNFSSVYMSTYTLVDNQFEFVYRPIMTIFDESKNHGQAAGGSCVFIADVDNAWAEYGSYLFIKFLQQDEWTSDFALKSGYFPITSTGTETAEYQEYVKNTNPSAAVTLQAMLDTEPGIGYGLIPFASDYGTGWKNIAKKMINTPEYTAEQAMKDFIKSSQDCLEMYWMSKGVIL